MVTALIDRPTTIGQSSSTAPAAPEEVLSTASAGAAAATSLETQYGMTILSKAMYASADQALALIAMLPKPVSPLR